MMTTEDNQRLGAFLAGEGTITLEESMRWSEELGYESMSGTPEPPPETELMVSVVRDGEFLA